MADGIEIEVNSTGAYDLLHADSRDYTLIIGHGYILQRPSKGSNPFKHPPEVLYAASPYRRENLLKWYHRKEDTIV